MAETEESTVVADGQGCWSFTFLSRDLEMQAGIGELPSCLLQSFTDLL